MKSPARHFRIALGLAVLDAVNLSPFERQGRVHAEFVNLDMTRLSTAAHALGFHELAERLIRVGDSAIERRLDDEELLRLCVWSAEMWSRHDAEPALVEQRVIQRSPRAAAR